jgi:hypothetical protein
MKNNQLDVPITDIWNIISDAIQFNQFLNLK